MASNVIPRISLADYDFGKPEKHFGGGSRGWVVKAADRKTGNRVAVKFLVQTRKEDSDRAAFITELETTARNSNSHPAILHILGAGFDPDQRPMIVTDLMSHGSLHEALEAERRGIRNPEWNATRKSICVFGTCAAMAHLHRGGSVHGDLKPRNVLLNDRWEPVVSDCGLLNIAEVLLWEQQPKIESSVHIAPELSLGAAECEIPMDVYAFAVMLYSFFAVPFELDDGKGRAMTFMRFIMRVEKGARFVKPSGVPEAHWALIQAAWDERPDQRPTFQDMVNNFHASHNYIFPGADLEAVIEYENRILAVDATMNE
jgi:serine/threonine protein kinase